MPYEGRERRGMLELYNFAQSTCSQKVRICLEEKGLLWTDHRLVSADHVHLSDWYLRLNPNGVVPTLVHNGRPVYESSVILQYLDAIHPEPPLVPPDAYGQAQMRAWLTYVDLVTTPAARYPSFQYGGLRIKFQRMTEAEFAEKMNRRPVKSAFYARMSRADGFPDDVLREAFTDLRRSVARMDRMLAEAGGPFLMRGGLSLADLAVAPLIDRLEDLGLEALWEERHPAVADWLRRMQALPSYRRCFYQGSRLSEQHPELGLGSGANRAVLAERFPPEAA
jgi:glutathione S-transferase